MPYYAQPSSSKTNQAAYGGAYGYGQIQQQGGQQLGGQQYGQQYGQYASQEQAYAQQLQQQQYAQQQYQQQQYSQQQYQQQQYAQLGQQQYGQLAAAQPEQYGTGYGQRYLAPVPIQSQLAGKPAFYDNIRGIQWDGQNAWYYDSNGAPGARNSWSTNSVVTAIEQRPTGAVIRLGNGTEGDYAVHRAHPSSVYYLDR